MSATQLANDAYGRVLDLGAGDAPDPRADETADAYHDGADHQFDFSDDWPLATRSVGGIIANHALEHVPHGDIPHVFQEAARVLEPGGWFEVSVPVGCDADADPTHQSEWSWRTPDLYCDPSKHWIPTLPFRVEDKRLHVWMIQPLEAFTPAIRFAAKHWPHDAWPEVPGATGELIILFRVNK